MSEYSETVPHPSDVSLFHYKFESKSSLETHGNMVFVNFITRMGTPIALFLDKEKALRLIVGHCYIIKINDGVIIDVLFDTTEGVFL